MTPEGIPAGVTRRLQLSLHGWTYAAGAWTRGPGEALPEDMIDVLTPDAFAAVVSVMDAVSHN
jgi:hypothetical protein